MSKPFPINELYGLSYQHMGLTEDLVFLREGESEYNEVQIA